MTAPTILLVEDDPALRTLTTRALQENGCIVRPASAAPEMWLALEAGQIVLAGSFIRPIETRKGDTIQADYGPYGSVSCYFA